MKLVLSGRREKKYKHTNLLRCAPGLYLQLQDELEGGLVQQLCEWKLIEGLWEKNL